MHLPRLVKGQLALALWLEAALVFAAPQAVAATRLVDFEAPVTTQQYQPSAPQDYSAYLGEVRFSQGWRPAPGFWNGMPPSMTYFNFNQGQIFVYFSVPVKNISFTMFSFYQNSDRGYTASVRYSSIPFDPAPLGFLSPQPILYYAPDSGGGTTVSVPATNVRYMIINFGGQPFAIDDFSYETTDAANFIAFARYKTPGSGFQPESGKPAVANMPVEIPLGTLFTVGLEKKQGFLDPVLPVTSNYTIAAKSTSPYNFSFGTRLFTASPVVDVGDTGPSEERAFMAVHLGTVSVVVSPLSIAGPTVTLNITIIKPSALGSTENSWDDSIIAAAHERGIPPQMLKGQVAQESDGSTFRVDNYRYEPCGADANYMSGGKTLIASSPYSLYALESARGTTLSDATIEPRNRYYIIDGVAPNGSSTRRQLVTADLGVTAKQIWDANDKWPPGSKHGINWSNQKCTALLKYLAAGNPLSNFSTDVLNFVAQTPTAASYGIMQVMYRTAVEIGWDVQDPSTGAVTRDPYYLLDYPANLHIARGGSLPVGSQVDVSNYTGSKVSFSNAPSVEAVFQSTFQLYNKWKAGYGAGVITHSHDYLPLQSGNVFQ